MRARRLLTSGGSPRLGWMRLVVVSAAVVGIPLHGRLGVADQSMATAILVLVLVRSASRATATAVGLESFVEAAGLGLAVVIGLTVLIGLVLASTVGMSRLAWAVVSGVVAAIAVMRMPPPEFPNWLRWHGSKRGSHPLAGLTMLVVVGSVVIAAQSDRRVSRTGPVLSISRFSQNSFVVDATNARSLVLEVVVSGAVTSSRSISEDEQLVVVPLPAPQLAVDVCLVARIGGPVLRSLRITTG